MKGYEMLCVIVLGLFSLLNDVTLTIQIMTLKIVINIINLGYAMDFLMLHLFFGYSHCNAAGVTIPVESTIYSKSCSKKLQRGVFWAGYPFHQLLSLSISLLLSPVQGISLLGWVDCLLCAENGNNPYV